MVRVINLWTTPDRNNPLEEGVVHMIFLDQEVNLFTGKSSGAILMLLIYLYFFCVFSVDGYMQSLERT
jgi:hypothetical protein